MSRSQDILGVIRGLQAVSKAGLRLQEEYLKLIWNTSSLKTMTEELAKTNPQNAFKNVGDLNKVLKESTDRVSIVFRSAKQYFDLLSTNNEKVQESSVDNNKSSTKESKTDGESFHKEKLKEDNLIKSHKVKTKVEYKIVLTPSDKELLRKLDKEHREKLKEQAKLKEETLNNSNMSENNEENREKCEETATPKVKVKPNKVKNNLSTTAKQRTVPSSRIGRMLSFGSLAAGLGIGTAAEYTKRTLGMSEDNDSATLFLTEANMNRIVDTLCKVRGAALKIGQMLSIQDESIISPQLAKALERVRQSADFMPNKQVEQVLRSELGDLWRDKLIEFDEKPFAAASIGQVHWARCLDGREVAMKIQYPGVARSIESDIDNLVGIMKVWNIFPKGMFIDNIVTVAKRELSWEVDYLREAQCTKRFKELMEPYPDFFVPDIISELSGKQVITTELVEGIPVDRCVELDDGHRKFVAMKINELCLLELMEFGFMQTDPNWANFLYDPDQKKIKLLDFGASRSYPKKFLDCYVKIIKAAADDDRKTVLRLSQKLGFLTGYESKNMEEAHVDAVMILGEVFRTEGDYNFSARETTSRIQNLVPTMLAQRLCPPPEEVYSIHRKLSGVFLLCSKLNVAFPARQQFFEMYNKYKFDYDEDDLAQQQTN